MSDFTQLQRLRAKGHLSSLDFHFARQMTQLVSETDERVALACALVSRAVSSGHTCLDLRRIAGKPPEDDDGAPVSDSSLPELSVWIEALRKSPLISEDPAEMNPLCLQAEGRLSLTRYRRYEVRLAARIRKQAAIPETPLTPEDHAVLDRLFSGSTRASSDDQRRAAEVALRRSLCIVSGGPGTGKTTTVVRILCALIERARAEAKPSPRILLVAPTGKAAARLAESIELGRAKLVAEDAVRAAIPDAAATIHRTLGYDPSRPTRFRHDETNPLPAEVVVVDEASMIDLALMQKLCAALRSDARLILLGDRHQLSSVEAGSVFADLCGPSNSRPSCLAESVVELRKSYRFDAQGGIAALSQAIRAGDAESASAILNGSGSSGVRHLATPGEARFLDVALAGFEMFARAVDPLGALAALTAFRILTPHREGDFAAQSLNDSISKSLHSRRSCAALRDAIMIEKNDSEVDLYNGDVGVIWDQKTAYFPGRNGVRSLAAARLPPYRTAYAMTVHKSQGSEFNDVLLVLPTKISRVITRELLYTAVSRAKARVTVMGDLRIFAAGIAEQTDRDTGLADLLWGMS